MMPESVLPGVTVTFEKAFKGDDVQIAKRGDNWTLYKFSASFKDETGQTKKHTTKSFSRPGPVGTSMVGSIELYHGNGQNGPYTSYTFTPDEGQEPAEKPAQTTQEPAAEPQKEKAPLPIQAAQGHSMDVQKTAIRRYIDFLWSVCTDNGKRSDEAAAAIFPGVRMIVGDFTQIHEMELANAGSEDAGMPTDEEMEAPEHQPRPELDDLTGCPF